MRQQGAIHAGHRDSSLLPGMTVLCGENGMVLPMKNGGAPLYPETGNLLNPLYKYDIIRSDIIRNSCFSSEKRMRLISALLQGGRRIYEEKTGDY